MILASSRLHYGIPLTVQIRFCARNTLWGRERRFPKPLVPQLSIPLPELKEMEAVGAAPCRVIRSSGITHSPGSCPHLAS